MSELLPCPFCGHDDQLYPAHHFPGTGPAYAIDCLRCGIDFTPREGMDVAAAWNRRASQAEIERLRAALEPFDRAASALFTRNYNKRDVVVALPVDKSHPNQLKLTAADFFAVRAALSGSKE